MLICSITYSADEVIKRDGEPDFVKAESDKMDLAIKEAQENMKTFISLVKANKNYKGFFIKKGFIDGSSRIAVEIL